MKPTKEQIFAIVARLMRGATETELRQLRLYEPEAMAAFVFGLEAVEEPVELVEAEKICCPHCGSTEPLVFFTCETACYSVENCQSGNLDPHRSIRITMSCREMNDGIGDGGYLFCEECKRETRVPKWVEDSIIWD